MASLYYGGGLCTDLVNFVNLWLPKGVGGGSDNFAKKSISCIQGTFEFERWSLVGLGVV